MGERWPPTPALILAALGIALMLYEIISGGCSTAP
jgi:hypothetical protein